MTDVRRTRRASRRRRIANGTAAVVVVAGLAAVNGPHVIAAADSGMMAYRHSRPDYKAANGSWETIEFPEKYRVNAIHAVLLHTGKVLIIAGSGNNKKQFEAGTFDSILWDPVTDTQKKIRTPDDLFCGGHAFLPNGNVLISGGTRRYEVLEDEVTRAAGVMTLYNPSATTGDVRVPKGTRFTGPDRRVYRSTEDLVLLPPAHAMGNGTMPGTARVWVEAVDEDRAAAFENAQRRFTVQGVQPASAAAGPAAVYGTADAISFDKQEYQGLDASYEFDPRAEQYVRTGDLKTSRWYPTLIGVKGGNVLAVSGLDQHGVIIDGSNELYDRSGRRWRAAEDLRRYFPTYPALLRMADDRLFYSGSNAGYGSATEGRQPGIWNLPDNTWVNVPGLRDPGMNETSSTVLLPPAQDQKVLVAGGGDVGDAPGSTARVDVVDLDARKKPRYEPGPDLLSRTRYLNTVILPDDTVLMANGSSGYRGRSGSDLHAAAIYTPRTNALREVAPNHIGRNYHSEALLLPDGRVITMGSDPLYADAENTLPGVFEQRLEIYSPPYLHGERIRPKITAAPGTVRRGSTFPVSVSSASGGIRAARLIRPSAVTHVTDTEQRSVALKLSRTAGGAQLTLDPREGIAPSGWYMLFVVGDDGTPSTGTWVRVE